MSALSDAPAMRTTHANNKMPRPAPSENSEGSYDLLSCCSAAEVRDGLMESNWRMVGTSYPTVVDMEESNQDIENALQQPSDDEWVARGDPYIEESLNYFRMVIVLMCLRICFYVFRIRIFVLQSCPARRSWTCQEGPTRSTHW